MSEQLTGTVQTFNEAKGFGFIKTENGPDVFVQYSAIQAEGRRALRKGQQVLFEYEQTAHGPQATKVIPLS